MSGVRTSLSRAEIIELLSLTDPADLERLQRWAYETMKRTVGEKVYYRGLLEYSNRCARDCLYCGIRRSNSAVRRYRLSIEEIEQVAAWVADNGYGSLTLQGGETRDRESIDFAIRMLQAVKSAGKHPRLPDGLGITLCIGEQKPEDYRRLFLAGAHRYLLRIETSNPTLYARIHPPADDWKDRVRCLETLQAIGYQVGSGVMIGIPGQSIADLADDVLFLKERGIDMIGMGPYLPHHASAMHGFPELWDDKIRLAMTLKMTAVMRLAIPSANIAATTALQAIHPMGREMGLKSGANVLMPLVTPAATRRDYQLYDGKPCLDDRTEDCRDCLLSRVASTSREVARDEWGDPLHFFERRKNEKASAKELTS